MKRVLLLTNKFPYGIVETFIEAEMECLPRDVEVMIIPTQSRKLIGTHRPLPEHVNVETLLNSRSLFEYLIDSLKMVFSKEFRVEISKRKDDKKLSFSVFYRLAGYFGRARQIADAVIEKYGTQLSRNEVVLYSYWLTTPSFAEMLIKRKTGCFAYSRAHRTDVYDGNCVYGVIPGQQDVISEIDRVYVCSKDGRDYLRKKYPELSRKIDYSYLGTKDYGYIEGDRRTEEFVIASCSRLVPVKRVHLIAEALSLITNKEVKWIHIGDGDEREKLERYVEKLPQNIRVKLVGNLQHDEVMHFYQDNHIDLFINVSASEGLPVSIMEVVSFGIPVIATNVGGSGEIITSGNGTLIPANFTSEELAEEIRKHIDMDEQSYVDLRNSTRRNWEENYSAKRNYTRFYSEITK